MVRNENALVDVRGRKCMPKGYNLLQEGDVILGEPGWQDGRKNERGTITVGFSEAGKHWNINPEGHDETRPDAKFVVIRASMSGGGTGMGPHDIYPDGWYIEARRLNNDGTDDGKGEIVEFYQTGCFTCMSWPVVVGKKRLLAVD